MRSPRRQNGDRVGRRLVVGCEERGGGAKPIVAPRMYEIILPKLRVARVSEVKPTGTSLEEVVELPRGVGKEELEVCAGDIPVCVRCGDWLTEMHVQVPTAMQRLRLHP